MFYVCISVTFRTTVSSIKFIKRILLTIFVLLAIKSQYGILFAVFNKSHKYK